ARAAVVEGADPDRLSEHHLLRERRLRDPAGGDHLLRPRRLEADPAGGGAAGGNPVRSLALRPGHEPAASADPPPPGTAGDARPERHHLQRVPAGEPDTAAAPRGRPPAGDRRTGAVL